MDFQNWVLTEHEVMGSKLTQAEGFILGVGAKMFTIAGPVIVYGVSENVVYGLIYWITTVLQRKKRNPQIAKADSLWQSKYLTGI